MCLRALKGTMTLRSFSLCTRILAVLIGSVSAADAQVMNVAVSPSPALVGQPVTVTVTGGSAPCGAVEIDYGDGTVITYASGVPLVQSHTWTTVGNKTVIARGQANCTGQATVTVSVGKKGAVGVSNRVAAGVNKSTELSSLIRIKSYFGLSQPGGVAAIAGQNFGAGAQSGRVVAKLKAWNGDDKDVRLTVKRWSPTVIEVEWPDDIAGVSDQMDAIVEVTNAVGNANWTVFFRADTDYTVLPVSRVRVVTCGDDANYNTCNGSGSETPGSCRGASFRGLHLSNWATVGNDTGTDEFEVRLKNGWVISGVDFHKYSGGGVLQSGAGAVWNPSPPAPTGSAAWNAKVRWEVTPSDVVKYCAFVHISGPKGVPF